MNEKQQQTLQQLSTLWEKNGTPSFEDLSTTIIQTHQVAQNSANKAINQSMTLRNWFIGCYIVEYEQKGKDRAQYGARLLERLEERVKTKGLNVTLFKLSRNFYITYPQVGTFLATAIHPTVSGELIEAKKSATPSHQLTDADTQKSATPSHQFETPVETLISKLSFSHIREIMTQSDPLARYFYEMECIKGTWSVKELASSLTPSSENLRRTRQMSVTFKELQIQQTMPAKFKQDHQ